MIAITRRRPEIGLLFWVAALGITGSVAVAAAEAAGFRPQQLVIPVTFVVIAFVLHLFLAARGIRGDQVLLPIAAALTALGLILVERLPPDPLLPPPPPALLPGRARDPRRPGAPSDRRRAYRPRPDPGRAARVESPAATALVDAHRRRRV